MKQTNIYTRISALAMLIAIFSLLLGKPLHMLSHVNSLDHCASSVSCCSNHCNDDGEKPLEDDERHACPACNYAISVFDVPLILNLESVVAICKTSHSGHQANEYYATLLHYSSRAPPIYATLA